MKLCAILCLWKMRGIILLLVGSLTAAYARNTADISPGENAIDGTQIASLGRNEQLDPVFYEHSYGAAHMPVRETRRLFNRPRSLQPCTSFDENPRDPGDAVSAVARPWSAANRNLCKLIVKWKDGTSRQCSGTLVGPFHVATAAHCTLDACKGGFAQEVLVKCGYGYVDGETDYAMLGTAQVKQCVNYRAYVSQNRCDDGVSSGPQDWDIQLCRLDRSLKHSHKYLGISYTARTSVTVRGYPSEPQLDTFIPNASHKLFQRTLPANTVGSRVYQLPDAWVFQGEDGGPYLYRSRPDKAYSLTGVHVAGGPGCEGVGRRVDTSFGQMVQSRLRTWKAETKWCNVIEDRVNLGGSFASVQKGVSATQEDPLWSTAINVQHGSYVSSKLQLINVGSEQTPAFKVSFHLTNLNRTEELYLGSVRRSLRKWSAKVIRKHFLSTLATNPGDFYRLYARWQPDCFASTDPNVAAIGTIHIV